MTASGALIDSDPAPARQQARALARSQAGQGTGVHADSVPDPLNPHQVLWNTAQFAGLRPGMAENRLVVDHRDHKNRLVGSLSGVVEEGVWTSGYSAPFGGIDLTRGSETADNVMALVARAVDVARREGINRIEVRCKPPHSTPSEPLVAFALFQAGFAVVESDLNFYIPLDGISELGEWEAGLRKQARRALREARALGLTTRQLDPEDESGWELAYEVLRDNRIEKGRPMRLPLEYIRGIRDCFGPLVRMLVTEGNRHTVAAALIYRVGRGRDVVQYWGDNAPHLAVSPMPVMVAAVVEHGLHTGASVLDIGISTDHGEPNLGLIQFKRAFGCSTELRTTMALDLREDR